MNIQLFKSIPQKPQKSQRVYIAYKKPENKESVMFIDK